MNSDAISRYDLTVTGQQEEMCCFQVRAMPLLRLSLPRRMAARASGYQAVSVNARPGSHLPVTKPFLWTISDISNIRNAQHGLLPPLVAIPCLVPRQQVS